MLACTWTIFLEMLHEVGLYLEVQSSSPLLCKRIILIFISFWVDTVINLLQNALRDANAHRFTSFLAFHHFTIFLEWNRCRQNNYIWKRSKGYFGYVLYFLFVYSVVKISFNICVVITEQIHNEREITCSCSHSSHGSVGWVVYVVSIGKYLSQLTSHVPQPSNDIRISVKTRNRAYYYIQQINFALLPVILLPALLDLLVYSAAFTGKSAPKSR
jgi:hypothetical protein